MVNIHSNTEPDITIPSGRIAPEATFGLGQPDSGNTFDLVPKTDQVLTSSDNTSRQYYDSDWRDMLAEEIRASVSRNIPYQTPEKVLDEIRSDIKGLVSDRRNFYESPHQDDCQIFTPILNSSAAPNLRSASLDPSRKAFNKGYRDRQRTNQAWRERTGYPSKIRFAEKVAKSERNLAGKLGMLDNNSDPNRIAFQMLDPQLNIISQDFNARRAPYFEQINKWMNLNAAVKISQQKEAVRLGSDKEYVSVRLQMKKLEQELANLSELGWSEVAEVLEDCFELGHDVFQSLDYFTGVIDAKKPRGFAKLFKSAKNFFLSLNFKLK